MTGSARPVSPLRKVRTHQRSDRVTEDTQEFTFKRAPLRGSVCVRVSPMRIEQLDRDGRIRAAVDLTKVRGARWAEAYANHLTVRTLVLKTDRGNFSIQQTKGLRRTTPSCPPTLRRRVRHSRLLRQLNRTSQ